MTAKTLILSYGNLSRGDDALGPLLTEFIESSLDLNDLELITDFQLQIEHALDLEERDLVLFIDASVACSQSYSFYQLAPEKDKSYTTHAMSPASVLSVYQNIVHKTPPPCFLLSIQAFDFELGNDLGAGARSNLEIAKVFVTALLKTKNLHNWLAKTTHA